MNIIDYIKENQNVSLTKAQKEGVNSVGNTALVAVPGAGKTAVFVTRVARLIYEENVSPSAILALTFSKASAQDMQERYDRWFGTLDKKAPVFQTIHSFCLGVLKNNYPDFYRYTIIEGESGIKSKTLRSCYYDCTDEYIDEDTLVDLETSIGFVKNYMIKPEEHDCDIPLFPEIYKKYEELKRQNMWIDFDDMLSLTANYFSLNPDAIKKYRSKIKYIMVDEYQDTSRLQNEILRLLVGGQTELFVVGDDDQSIYKFRGASPEYFLNFKENFGGKVIYMEDNFRSTKEITNLASDFIKTNKHRYNKEIKSKGKAGKKVVITKYEDAEKQTKSVISEVKKSKAKTKAILYRNNFSAIPYLYFLAKENIPFYVRNGNMIFQSPVIQDIIAYFELILGDYTAFDKIASKYYIPKSVMKNLENKNFKSVPEYLTAIVEELKAQKKSKYTIEKVIDLKYRLSLYDKKTKPDVVFLFISRYSGYFDFLVHNNGEDSSFVLGANQALSALECIATNSSSVEDFYKTINKLCENFAKENEKNKNKAEIVLSTIHSAKGLEWDEVWLIDIVDRVFPTFQSRSSPELLEEERRLFYVGMTRAKTKLTISYPVSSDYGDKNSRFIEELSMTKENKIPKETDIKPPCKNEVFIHKTFKNKVKIVFIAKDDDIVFVTSVSDKEENYKKYSYSRFLEFFERE